MPDKSEEMSSSATVTPSSQGDTCKEDNMPDEQHEAADNNATDKKADVKTSLIWYCEIVVSKPKLTFGKFCGTKG